MKLDELLEGVSRILDSATEKFNTLCEEKGIEPDDPILTGEDEESEEEEGGEGTEAKEGGEEADAVEDQNTMPQPDAGAEGASAAAPIGDMPSPVEGAAPQAPVEGDASAAIPPVEGGAQVEGGAEGAAPAPQMTPEEEEALKAQQAAK